MKRLFVLFLFVLATIAGCNSSSGNDDDEGSGGNTNNNGNGGKYTVSGSVTLNTASGSGISGATVVLATVSSTPTTLMMTTGSNGAYSFGNIAAGSYVVTVAKDNYTFTPAYVSVTVADKNVAVQTFVGTTEGGNTNTGGNAGSSALYPLKTNATWNYDTVDVISSFSVDGKMIEKVTGTQTQGGKTYWAITSTEYDSDGVEDGQDTFFFRVENNILYTYGEDFLNAKAALKAAKPAQAAILLKAMQGSAYGEYPLFKFGVSAGTTWDIYKDSGTYEGGSYSITSTGKYVGTETVGSYSNCSKYEISYSTESSSTSFGKVAGKWDRTIWLAANVGPVKTVEKFYTGSTLADVELLDTMTKTLKTVQIP